MLATQNRIAIGAPTSATRATCSRVAYLDNLRIYLTLLALPYGLVFSLKSRLRRGARAG